MDKKIKRIETFQQETGGERYLCQVQEFDLAGNEIYQEDFNSEGLSEAKITSTFNDKGHLMEQKHLTLDGELADHKVFHRNEEGELTKTEILFQDGFKSIQTSKFDKDSKIQEIREEDEEGELESLEINHLNEEKQIVRKELFSYENKLTEAFAYAYNESGLLQKREEFDHRKKLLSFTEFEYDEKGNTKLRAKRNRKGKLSEFLQVDYDDDGRVIKQNFSGQFYFTFEYDQKGNQLLEQRTNAAGDLEYESKFEYDSEGQLSKELNLNFTKELCYFYHD